MTRARMTAVGLTVAVAMFVVGGAAQEAQASHCGGVVVRSYYYDYCPPVYYYPQPVVYYRPAPVYYRYGYALPVYRSHYYYYPRSSFGLSFSFSYSHHRHHRH